MVITEEGTEEKINLGGKLSKHEEIIYGVIIGGVFTILVVITIWIGLKLVKICCLRPNDGKGSKTVLYISHEVVYFSFLFYFPFF